MEKDKWFGISREEIDWFPTIDSAKCDGCLECVKKCSNDVFVVEDGKPKVANEKNCEVSCRGCDKVCPQGAISHPSGEYLEKLSKHKDFKWGCSCGGNC